MTVEKQLIPFLRGIKEKEKNKVINGVKEFINENDLQVKSKLSMDEKARVAMIVKDQKAAVYNVIGHGEEIVISSLTLFVSMLGLLTAIITNPSSNPILIVIVAYLMLYAIYMICVFWRKRKNSKIYDVAFYAELACVICDEKQVTVKKHFLKKTK